MGRKAGRGDPIITEQKVTDYLNQHSPPLAGTTQIAEQFDVARPSVIERLDTLEGEGVVGKRKVGQSYAWYLTEWKEVVHESTGPAPGEEPPRKEQKESDSTPSVGGELGVAFAVAGGLAVYVLATSGGLVTSLQSFGSGAAVVLVAVVMTFLFAKGGGS